MSTTSYRECSLETSLRYKAQAESSYLPTMAPTVVHTVAHQQRLDIVANTSRKPLYKEFFQSTKVKTL